MKIGFNLLLWTGHVEPAHDPILDQLKRAGYDGVEVPIFGGTVAEYQRTGHAIRNAGLDVTGITVIPDETCNPLSPDPAIRRAAIARLAWATECTAALGATLLAGPFHSPLGVFSGHGATEDEKAACADVHRAAAETAQQHGVTLVMEYLSRFECYFVNTMRDAVAHAARVDHPAFRIMHDTFHANIEEKDPIAVIAEAGRFLHHVHISENDRGTPGRGHVPWPAVFRALRQRSYDGWLTIEAFGQALPALAAATRVWRPFFESPEQVYREGIDLIRREWAAAA